MPLFTLSASAAPVNVDEYIKNKLEKADMPQRGGVELDISEKISRLSKVSDVNTKSLKDYCDTFNDSYFGEAIFVAKTLREKAESKYDLTSSSELTQIMGKAIEMYDIEGKNFKLLADGKDESPEFLANEEKLKEFRNMEISKLLEISNRLMDGEIKIQTLKQDFEEPKTQTYIPSPHSRSYSDSDQDLKTPIYNPNGERTDFEKKDEQKPLDSSSFEQSTTEPEKEIAEPKFPISDSKVNENEKKIDELFPSMSKPLADKQDSKFSPEQNFKSEETDFEKKDVAKPLSSFSFKKSEDETAQENATTEPEKEIAEPKFLVSDSNIDKSIAPKELNTDDKKLDVNEDPKAHAADEGQKEKKGFFWE